MARFRQLSSLSVSAHRRACFSLFISSFSSLPVPYRKNMVLPRTVTFVTSIRGGCVFTWQTYTPWSSLRTPEMASLQLFGYWNLTLYLESDIWVVLSRVKRDAQSAFRRSHMTCEYVCQSCERHAYTHCRVCASPLQPELFGQFPIVWRLIFKTHFYVFYFKLISNFLHYNCMHTCVRLKVV